MLGEEISTKGPIHNIYYQYIIYNSEIFFGSHGKIQLNWTVYFSLLKGITQWWLAWNVSLILASPGCPLTWSLQIVLIPPLRSSATRDISFQQRFLSWHEKISLKNVNTHLLVQIWHCFLLCSHLVTSCGSIVIFILIMIYLNKYILSFVFAEIWFSVQINPSDLVLFDACWSCDRRAVIWLVGRCETGLMSVACRPSD